MKLQEDFTQHQGQYLEFSVQILCYFILMYFSRLFSLFFWQLLSSPLFIWTFSSSHFQSELVTSVWCIFMSQHQETDVFSAADELHRDVWCFKSNCFFQAGFSSNMRLNVTLYAVKSLVIILCVQIKHRLCFSAITSRKHELISTHLLLSC